MSKDEELAPDGRSVSSQAAGREPMRRSFVLLTEGRLPWIDAMAIIHELLGDLSQSSRRVAMAAIIEAYKPGLDAACSEAEATQREGEARSQSQHPKE